MAECHLPLFKVLHVTMAARPREIIEAMLRVQRT